MVLYVPPCGKEAMFMKRWSFSVRGMHGKRALYGRKKGKGRHTLMTHVLDKMRMISVENVYFYPIYFIFLDKAYCRWRLWFYVHLTAGDDDSRKMRHVTHENRSYNCFVTGSKMLLIFMRLFSTFFMNWNTFYSTFRGKDPFWLHNSKSIKLHRWELPKQTSSRLIVTDDSQFYIWFEWSHVRTATGLWSETTCWWKDSLQTH